MTFCERCRNRLFKFVFYKRLTLRQLGSIKRYTALFEVLLSYDPDELRRGVERRARSVALMSAAWGVEVAMVVLSLGTGHRKHYHERW